MELPTNIKAHNVFHIHTLKLYTQAQDDRQPTRPPALLIDNQEEYEVESILDKRIRNRRTEYLIKWLGYPIHEASWEPSIHLKNSQEFIQEFESKQTKQQTNHKGTTTNSVGPSTRTRYGRLAGGSTRKD